jgi:alginate O-acetyltransferase complex protein AlgI
MLFFSYTFVIFVIAFFCLYWSVPNVTVRRWVLLLGCALFLIYYSGPAGVLPIVLLAVGTYFAGLSRRRWLCVIWIAVCTASLLFYKYTNFLFQGLVAGLSPDMAQLGRQFTKTLLPAAPPLGISFFAFEFIHYLTEIHRGRRPICSPLRFGLFSFFWPTVVAGPIKRYRQFTVSAGSGMRQVSLDDVREGMVRIAVGVVKKFTADSLTAWIGFIDHDYAVLPLERRWLIFGAIGMRILLDFSGYSDMAIGFARMMGIRIPENFNWPYLAVSINDFWHRWHISLSTWIRDYIYIPLGGSRHGLFRKGLNALFAMALCGLWHGASWNFVLWGLYHGLGLVLSNNLGRVIRRWGGQLHQPLQALPGGNAVVVISRGCFLGLCWCSTVFFVFVGWLLFFYPVAKAWEMTKLLFVR